MSRFSDAAQAALPQFYDTFSEAVTYTDPDNTVAVSEAIRSAQEVDTLDVTGVIVRITREEFFIKGADLVDGGGDPITPSRDSKITDADGREYECDLNPEYLHDSLEWRLPCRKIDL